MCNKVATFLFSALFLRTAKLRCTFQHSTVLIKETLGTESILKRPTSGLELPQVNLSQKLPYLSKYDHPQISKSLKI